MSTKKKRRSKSRKATRGIKKDTLFLYSRPETTFDDLFQHSIHKFPLLWKKFTEIATSKGFGGGFFIEFPVSMGGNLYGRWPDVFTSLEVTLSLFKWIDVEEILKLEFWGEDLNGREHDKITPQDVRDACCSSETIIVIMRYNRYKLNGSTDPPSEIQWGRIGVWGPRMRYVLNKCVLDPEITKQLDSTPVRITFREKQCGYCGRKAPKINPKERAKLREIISEEELQRLFPHELQICNGCKQILYCDRDCQKAHWKVHKSDCKKARRETNV